MINHHPFCIRNAVYFEQVFWGIDNCPSKCGTLFYTDTPNSRMLNLDFLVAQGPADPNLVVISKILIEQASAGVGEKHNPIDIIPLDNDKLRVIVLE